MVPTILLLGRPDVIIGPRINPSKFSSGTDAKFRIDSGQVILDSFFGDKQLTSGFTVRESLNHQLCDGMFLRRQRYVRTCHRYSFWSSRVRIGATMLEHPG